MRASEQDRARTVAMSHVDPYFVVEDEIRDSLDAVEKSLYDDKLEGVVRSGATGGELRRIQANLEQAEMQLSELCKAVDASAADPAKFSLSLAQVNDRKKQTDEFRFQASRLHDRISDLFEAARLSKRAKEAASPAGKGVVSSYMSAEADDQLDSQQMLMRRQDEDLDDLTVAARRVGQMGLQIGDEIELQTQVMGEVEEEMDTTRSRLKTAQKMMNKLGKKMGKWQSVVMGGLVVLLIILMAVAFG